ncbi:MAG: hypothetical protein PWP40_649 [Rhodocyclaceae bacterium]|nr:hypothetical protein [Rhodocyclaceae bacterium]
MRNILESEVFRRLADFTTTLIRVIRSALNTDLLQCNNKHPFP